LTATARSGERDENLSADAADRYTFAGCPLHFPARTEAGTPSAMKLPAHGIAKGN
jgi:hypothetical protein